MNKDIAKLLLEAKAVDLNTEEGFTYASGAKGPIYCDNRILLSYPEKRDAIVNAFVELSKQYEFDIVAGVATGAIAWGALVADRLGKPFVYVRASAKDHGKGNQIEGELEEGKKVLVIEDLINSGGSSLEACKAVAVTCDVVCCLAIFTYGFKDAHNKFSTEDLSLNSLTDFETLVSLAQSTDYIDEEAKNILMLWQQSKEWK